MSDAPTSVDSPSMPDRPCSQGRPTLLDTLHDPFADPVRDRARLRLATMMGVVGILHFVVPGPFRAIVPRWFPWRREAVLWSGVAEVASGALLAHPRTQRAGGALCAATIVAVYPANVQMAVDATRGVAQVPGPAWVSWARLPMQIPMLMSALRFARGR